MGRELARAFEKRQLGDYGHTSVISKKEADELLESGRMFVGNVVKYLKKEKVL